MKTSDANFWGKILQVNLHMVQVQKVTVKDWSYDLRCSALFVSKSAREHAKVSSVPQMIFSTSAMWKRSSGSG